MYSIAKKLLNDNVTLFGLLVLLFLFFMMTFSVFITSENVQNLDNRLLSIGSPEHILGTDHFGRDIFKRIIKGSTVSIKVGLIASIISLVIGAFLGIIAGYFGSWIDTIIMRLTEIVMAFPVLLFLIAISAAFKPGINTSMFAIGMGSWPPMARLIRSHVLIIKSKEYILSVQALGFNDSRVIFFHVLPNCISPLIVLFTLGISGAIMAESSLSFLGLGVQPPTASWGSMINEGKDFLRISPWISLCPGIAIAITVLAFNLVGEGLRDALDVKLEDV